MSKINNIHNNFIHTMNTENAGINEHTRNYQNSLELSGNCEQANLDSFSAEKAELQELDLAGTPQIVLKNGILSEKYLLDNGFSPVTKDSAVFQLGKNEDEGKYSLDIQIFYNLTTKQYTYGVKVFKEGKQVDTKDNAELEAFLIANYGFGLDELLSDEHINFDKKSKSYILDLRPVVSPEEVLSLEKEGGFELIKNEKPERTNRRFAIALIHSKFDSLINEYSQMLTVLGGLDFGIWYEGAKMGIQEISEFLGIENFHYSGVSRIKELVKKRDEICKKLDNAIDQPDLFNALFKDFLGTDYSDEKMQGLRDIRHKGVNGNESDSVKQAECYREFEKQFPDNDVDKLLEKWDSELTQKINTLGNIVIMLLLTKCIGAGAQKAGAEVLKAIGEKNVKLAMSKFVVFSNAIAQTVTTMSAFEGSKTLVRGLTNGEDLSTDEIIDRTVTSLGEGAIMGVEIALMEMFLISPMTKALSKRLVKFTAASEKIAASTAEAGSKGLAMEEVMKIYEAETKGMREAVHTALAVPTLSLGFTGIETAKAKFGEFNAEQYRELLIQNKENTQEDINAYLAMSEDELRTEYTINTAKEQLESMTTIEGIGILFKRVQAAVIADKALSPQYNNILKARLCPVEDNGVTKYELRTPDDKPLQFVIKEKSGNKTVTKFSKPEDAVASYMTLCTDIAKTIVKDTKNTKIANPLNLSSRIKKAKTVEEVIVIQNEINDANLSEEVKNRLKVECYKKYAKLTEENPDYEYKKVDGEEKFEEDDDFSQIGKSYAEMAERYEQELETLDEAAKKAANQNIQKLVELGAPDIIIYHEQRRAVECIQEYKKIKAEVEAIGDEKLRNELLNDLDNMIKSDNEKSMRGRMNSFRKILDRKTKTPSARLMQFLKEEKPEVYEQLLKNPEDIDDPHFREVKEEFSKIDKYEFLMDKITLTNDKKEADELYEQYLQDEFVSDNPKIDAEVKERCRQINRDFGVKVFLPVNLKEAGQALILVYQELANYREFARQNGETAKMPRRINFMRASKLYLNSDAIGGYSPEYNTMSVDGLKINRNNKDNASNKVDKKKNTVHKDAFNSIKNIIRHEMAHANIHPEDDYEFPEWFNPMVELDELFNGGADVNIIMSAIKNMQEFLAYTAECDMSKFSDNFKEKLVKLGMPRWMTKMQNPEASKDVMPQGVERVFAELCIIDEFERLHGIRESDSDDELDDGEFAKRLNPDEMQVRRNDIKSILKEAEEKERKISAKEITDRLHIKPQDLYNAMRGDDELLALFDKVKDSTRGRKPGGVKKEQVDNKTERTQKKEPQMYPEWKTDSEYLRNVNPHNAKRILKLKEEAARPDSEKLYSNIQPAIQELVSNLQNGQTSDLCTLKIGNNKVGIVAQKDEFGITTVTVKNWQGPKESWDKKADTEDSMQLVLNPDGSLLSAKLSISEFFEENDVVNYDYSYFTSPDGQTEVQSTRNYYFDISRYQNNPNEPTSQKTATYIPETDSMDGWKCSETSGIFLDQPIAHSSDTSGLMKTFLDLIKTDKKTKPDLSQKNTMQAENPKTQIQPKTAMTVPSNAVSSVFGKVKDNVSKKLEQYVDRDIYTEAFKILKSNPEQLNDFIKSQLELIVKDQAKLLPETKEFLQNILKEIIVSKIGSAETQADLNNNLSGVRKLQGRDRTVVTKNLFTDKDILKTFIDEGFNKGQIASIICISSPTLTQILEKYDFKVDGRKKTVEQTQKADSAKKDEGAELQRKKREAQSGIPESIAHRKDIQKNILKIRCINSGATITEIWLSIADHIQAGNYPEITPLDIGKYLKALGLLKPVNKIVNEASIIKLYKKRSPRTGKREYSSTDIAAKLGYTKQQVELVLRRANLIPARKDYSRQVAKIRQMIMQDFSVPISTIAKTINETDSFVRARIAEEGLEHKEYLMQKAREKLNIDKDIYYLYTDKEASLEEICELFDCTKEDALAAIKRHELVRNKLKAQSNANNNTTGKSTESEGKTSSTSGTTNGTGKNVQSVEGAKPKDINIPTLDSFKDKTIKDLQNYICNLHEQKILDSNGMLNDICGCIEYEFDLIECTEKELNLVKNFIIELEKINAGITTENEVLKLPFINDLLEIRAKVEQISIFSSYIEDIHQDFSGTGNDEMAKFIEVECMTPQNLDVKLDKLSKVVDVYISSENLNDAEKAIKKSIFEIKNPNIREEAENYVKEKSHNGVVNQEQVEEYIDSLIAIQDADKSTALGDFATIIRDSHMTNQEAVTNYLTIKQIFDKSISQYNKTINEYNVRTEKYNKEVDEYNAEQVRKYGQKAKLKDHKKYKKTTTVPRPEIMFPEMYAKYSNKGEFEKKILENLINNYYLQEESIAITTCKGDKNQSKRAVSIITIEAKEAILRHWTGQKAEIIDKFERALRVFASSDDGEYGIKDNLRQNNPKAEFDMEVKITGTGLGKYRLYSKNGDYVFDVFDDH